MKWDETTFYSEAEQFDLGLNAGHRTRNSGLNQSYISFLFIWSFFFFYMLYKYDVLRVIYTVSGVSSK